MSFWWAYLQGSFRAIVRRPLLQVNELQGISSQDSLVIALCGNKVDLVDGEMQRQVETEVVFFCLSFPGKKP